jgi:hypothetical protein
MAYGRPVGDIVGGFAVPLVDGSSDPLCDVEADNAAV